MSDSGFGGTITGGIQDVSGLLPILGTNQCEKHVGSALDGGYLYAAATPLSIFGSLGIVKAGVSILIASISLPKPSLAFTPLPKLSFTSSRQCWLGARVLNNAGFDLSGSVAALIGMKEKRYKAETRLIEILDEKHIDKPEKLSLDWTSGQWNVGVILFTIAAAALSVVPYIHLTSHPHQPVHSPWAYPLLRSAGSCIATVCCQFIIQTRIISLMKNRIIFMIMNRVLVNELKKNKDSDDEPILQLRRQKDFEWDSTLPSEECLWSLEQYLLSHQSSTGSNMSSVQPSVRENEQSPPNSPPFTPVVSESANKERPHVLEFSDYKHISERMKELQEDHFPTTSNLDRLCILSSWILLFLSIPAAIIGYVGCFTLVTNNTSQNGPLIWLGLEAALSVIRILLWASNPRFDEETEVTIQLKLSEHPPLVTTEKDVDVITATNHLTLIPERQFLEHITPFTGPLEQFRLPQNIVLYFTLSGDRRNNHLHLYITAFDLSKRTAFTMHSDLITEMLYLDTTMGIDPHIGEMQATLQTPIDQNHPRWKNHVTIIDPLLRYYALLLNALNKANFVKANAPNRRLHPFLTYILTYFRVAPTSSPTDPLAKLQWKWNLLPQVTVSEDQTHGSITSIIPPPSLSEHNRLYLQRGYEHHLKTKLMQNWGKWISDNMEAIRRDALIDCQYAPADLTSEEAQGELLILEGQLFQEAIVREFKLLESSMRLEEILYSRSKSYMQAVVRERKDEELEERLSSEFAIGRKKRLDSEFEGVKARLDEARKAALATHSLNLNMKRSSSGAGEHEELLNQISGEIARTWEGCMHQGMKDWRTLYDSMTAQIHKLQELDVGWWLLEVEESASERRHLLPMLAHWEVTRKSEQQVIDETIEGIRTAEQSKLDTSYHYPNSSSDTAARVHSRFMKLKLKNSSIEAQDALEAQLSFPSVFDADSGDGVNDADTATILHVIQKSSTRSVINVARNLIDEIPENKHLLYLRSRNRELKLDFIQRNRDRWWNEQSTNSAMFYFCPDRGGLSEKYVYGRRGFLDGFGVAQRRRPLGRIAQIMIFIQNPTRLRLRLLHMRKGEASISIQKESKELRLIHPEEIAQNDLRWQDFELDRQFEPGRYELELIVNLKLSRRFTSRWFAVSLYGLRDIQIEFFDNPPSSSRTYDSSTGMGEEAENEVDEVTVE